MRVRHGLQVTMLALTGQKRLYYKLFSEWWVIAPVGQQWGAQGKRQGSDVVESNTSP